jgi:hypothetical protein
MNITLWNEKGLSDIVTINATVETHPVHKENQRTFLQHCYTQLVQEGWKFAYTLDPDDYLLINPRVRDPNDPMYRVKIDDNTFQIPTQKETCSLVKFLNRLQPYRNHTINPYLYESPCMQFARKQFSNHIDSPRHSDNNNHTAPINIDTRTMNTMMWEYPATMTHRLVGKGIAELSRLTVDDYATIKSLHRPVGKEERCDRGLLWLKENDSPIVIHHYPATWEQIQFRKPQQAMIQGKEINGKKVTNATAYWIERHQREGKHTGVREQHIQEWLGGFVESIGVVEAGRLLQDAGKPKEAAKGAHIVWGGDKQQ